MCRRVLEPSPHNGGLRENFNLNISKWKGESNSRGSHVLLTRITHLFLACAPPPPPPPPPNTKIVVTHKLGKGHVLSHHPLVGTLLLTSSICKSNWGFINTLGWKKHLVLKVKGWKLVLDNFEGFPIRPHDRGGLSI